MDEFLSVDSVSIYYEENEETYSFLLVDLEKEEVREIKIERRKESCSFIPAMYKLTKRFSYLYSVV